VSIGAFLLQCSQPVHRAVHTLGKPSTTRMLVTASQHQHQLVTR